jgi:hypothetical protein
MAANQIGVAEILAVKLVDESGNLMNAIKEFQDIFEWATKAGINFTDTDIETMIGEKELLQHAVGANYNQVGGFILPALVTWLKTQEISGGDLDGKTYWEALQMLRRT